jgi:hypothetical protein
MLVIGDSEMGKTSLVQALRATDDRAQVISADDRTVGIDICSLTLTGAGGGSVRWNLQGYNFVASSSQTTIRFRDLSTHTNSIDLLLTNIAVTGQAGSGNTAPIANPDQYAIASGSTFRIDAPGVLANDTAAQSQALTAMLVAQPSHGSVTLNANGSFTYTPLPGFTGSDSFSYQARDASLSSPPATVTLTVSSPSAELLVNADFESGLAAWSSSGNLSPKNTSPYTAASGSGLIAFNDGNRIPGGSISQSFLTYPGKRYSVSYDIGTYSFNTTNQTLRFSVHGNAPLLQETTSVKGLNGGVIRWVTKSHNFIADGSMARLTFTDISPGTNGIDLLLDHVRVVESPSAAAAALVDTVPEPFDGLKPGTAAIEIHSDTISIRTLATGGGLYFLETSTDLKKWDRILERQIEDAGPVEFLQSVSSEAPLRKQVFYRIGSSSP